MKEIKESLLEKLCKDDILNSSTVRRSNPNAKQLIKPQTSHSSIQKSHGAPSKSPAPLPKPKFFVQRNNVRLIDDPRTSEDFSDPRTSGNYETRQKKHPNVHSPTPHPRSTPPVPVAHHQNPPPADNEEDEEENLDDIDIHSECVPLKEYRELKDKYKKWLNENKVLLQRIHFLEEHLK